MARPEQTLTPEAEEDAALTAAVEAGKPMTARYAHPPCRFTEMTLAKR